MTDKKLLYVVHCIDTEGPLNESLEATFNRLEEIFDIKLEPTKENLKKIQNKELDLKGMEDEVAKVFDKRLLDYNSDWAKLDKMLDKILSPEFRAKYADSEGNPWVFNWFPVDHVGFETNPRKRDIGYHKIYDHYVQKLEETGSEQDGIGWHFHPASISREAHKCANTTIISPHLFESLCRDVIDRQWFPTMFRAGFHTERPDNHWLLEQWVPFDFSNQATLEDDSAKQRDVTAGRFGDWRRAPNDWRHYHPDHDDYQNEGDCRRTIFKCLNVGTRLRLLTEQEVRNAFERANKGEITVMAITDHDFRDMSLDVQDAYDLITKVAKDYPDVTWKNSEARAAARAALGLEEDTHLELDVRIEEGALKTLVIEANKDIFGPQPFLAIKTKDDKYIYQNLDFQKPKREWSYSFDSDSIVFDTISKIGVAANDERGEAYIVVIDVENNNKKTTKTI